MKIFEFKNNDGIIIERFEGREEDGNIIKDGRYERWFNSGIKECEGEYLENYKYGIWTYYYPDGSIYKKGEFINNNEVGDWEQFSQFAPKPLLPEAVPEKHSVDVAVPGSNLSWKNKQNISKAKDSAWHQLKENKKPALFVRSDIRDEIDDIEDESFFKRLDNSNPWYLAIAVLSIILIVLVISVVVPDFKINQISAGNNENIYGNAPSDTASIVRSKFNEWVNYTNAENLSALMEFYADEVNYYRWGQTVKEKIKNDKMNFFNKYNTIKISVDNVNIQNENRVRYVCTYDKSYSMINQVGKKDAGRIKSRLVFQVINGELKIITEKDDKPVS
jgi:hypothetical protein